jgi:uridine kinase
MQVVYEGEERTINEPCTIREAFQDKINELGSQNIIAARFNNQVESLDYQIVKDGKVELLDKISRDGRYIYIRGCLYIMSKAFSEVYPSALLTVNYQLSNAMFCEVDNMEVTDEMIDKVRTRMQEIIAKDLPITKVQMTQEEAEEFYKRESSLKGRLQTDSTKEYVSLYYCEDYYNYFYGVMPATTGVVNLVDIEKFLNGFIVKYPSTTEPHEISKAEQNRLKQVSAMEEYKEIYKIMGVNTVHKLNKAIREGRMKELILFSEAIHERKIAEIAQRIKVRENDVKIILIAGPSSSGKTTFANKLGMGLRVLGIRPVTLSTDNYFVERDQNPKDEKGNYDFECIEAIDTKLLNDHLQKLMNGEEVELPTFDFLLGTKKYNGNKLKLEKDQVLVMEGIHCLNDKLTELIPPEKKFKIYISDLTVLNIDYYNRISTTDTRLIRRMVRDFNFRGYSALHTLQMWYSVNRGETKNIFPYQETADVMFNSSIVYEIAALKKYAMPLLEDISPEVPEYSEAQRLLNMIRYFDDVDCDLIPNTSLLREFIGGSLFDVY